MFWTAVGLFTRGNIAGDEAWCRNRGVLASIRLLFRVSTSQFQMVEEDLFFPGRLLDPPPPPRSTTTRTPSTAPLPVHHQSNGLYHDTKDRWSLSQDGSTSTSASTFYNPFVYPSSGLGTESVSTLPVSLHDTDTIFSLDYSNPRSSDSPPLESCPLNPRDHSLLEYIYTGMHAARFINLSPLSLLAHSLPLYFESLFMLFPSRDLFLAD
jgi:hypothetical protein